MLFSKTKEFSLTAQIDPTDSPDPEKQRAEIALKYCAYTKEKPIHELLRETIKLGEAATAAKLSVHPGFVASWFPKQYPNNRIEPGWEPSSGFVACAVALLKRATP